MEAGTSRYVTAALKLGLRVRNHNHLSQAAISR